MSSLLVRGGSGCDVDIDRGRVVAAWPAGEGPGGHRAPVLDATGCTVLPGFVDLQVNGAIGADLTREPWRVGEVAAFLPQCGVTSFMPTVISSPPADIAAAVATMRSWAESTDDDPSHRGARSLGVHVEGPFLAPARRGAHPPQHLRAPSVDAVTGWSEAGGVALVTLAPELSGATEVIAALAGRGVTVCLGHTDAGPAEIAAAVRAGARGATHLFNAMGAMSARAPGPAGAILDHDSLIAGIIVDRLHVSPEMTRLAWRLLGADRLALVSDAIAALGLPHGAYAIGDTPVVVDASGARTVDGVLAGSVLRLDEAVRNLVDITGCAVADAARAASTTPARLAARADVGRLVAGCRGDVVLLDGQLRVVATVVGGRVVHDPQARCGTDQRRT